MRAIRCGTSVVGGEVGGRRQEVGTLFGRLLRDFVGVIRRVSGWLFVGAFGLFHATKMMTGQGL
jgi:hypothetical protein